MKIKANDYDKMKNMIKEYLQKRELNINLLIADYRKQGLSDKRLQWDLLRASGGIRLVTNVLYQYLNDIHIDTALRNIMRDLSLESL